MSITKDNKNNKSSITIEERYRKNLYMIIYYVYQIPILVQ